MLHNIESHPLLFIISVNPESPIKQAYSVQVFHLRMLSFQYYCIASVKLKHPFESKISVLHYR